MRFARAREGELHTENIDTIVLTVAELKRLQAIPLKACVATIDKLTIYVSPTPDAPTIHHTPVEPR